MPWLTYQQIGERFGLGTEAARTRVRRLGWRTQPGNDGRTLAMVPDDADLRPGGVHPAGPPGAQPVGPPDDRDETGLTGPMAGALTALETAVTSLTQRAEAAERGREWAERRIAAVELDKARAEAARVSAVLLAADLQLRIERAQAVATAAAQRAEALEAAEAARRARGLLARLRAAVRGG